MVTLLIVTLLIGQICRAGTSRLMSWWYRVVFALRWHSRENSPINSLDVMA
jgi:hypothetical protein